MIVLTHTPIKGFSTLSVERISKSIHFSPSDDIPGPFALPEKIITPKFIGKEAGKAEPSSHSGAKKRKSGVLHLHTLNLHLNKS